MSQDQSRWEESEMQPPVHNPQPPQGGPQYGPPQTGGPQYGPPQPGGPQYGQPQYGQPQYGPPGYGPHGYGPQGGGPLTSDDRNWAMGCHLAAFSGYFTGCGHIVGPLIVWLIKRESSPFVDMHGKESLNYNISMTLWLIILVGLCFTIILTIPAFIALMVLFVADIIWRIQGCIKASNGENFSYPLTIRFFS